MDSLKESNSLQLDFCDLEEEPTRDAKARSKSDVEPTLCNFLFLIEELKRGRRVTLMAASSSLSTGRCKRRVVLLRQPSREDDYEGPRRYCRHRLVAPRWTAWTDGNPGRRFYGCPYYYQDGGCGFFSWHDNVFGERENIVINELLNEIDKLYDENCKLRKAEDGQRLNEELDAIHCELRKLKCRQDLNDRELRNEKMKFKAAISVLLLTCVWLCLFYLRM